MIMDRIVDFISIITLSGFSSIAEKIIGYLGFTKSLATIPVMETLAWLIIFIISVGPNNLLICLLNVNKSFTQKIHPNAVVVLKKGKNIIPADYAEKASLHVVVTVMVELLLSFIFSFEADSLTTALLLGIAIPANAGWLLLLVGKTSLLAGFSAEMKIVMCIALIIARIKFLNSMRHHFKPRRK